MMSARHRGWLLDLYEDPAGGITLWLLADDGRRLRLRQEFPVTFYAGGEAGQLRALWRWLSEQQPAPRLARAERRDLFLPGLQTVLAVECADPAAATSLFRRVAQSFPDLTYYDADLPLALRHAGRFGSFPLARCQVTVDAGGWVIDWQALDTPWELDPLPPPLSILTLEPDGDPQRRTPGCLLAGAAGRTTCLALDPPRPLLINLRSLLERHDPDVLLTAWGDTWLLPRLEALAEEHHLPLPLSRHPGRASERRAERTYFSYGQIIYRGSQVHLFGRWHIDRCNATLWEDYSLAGTLEAARVTALPVQNAARTSPGTGISAMQIVTALRLGVLVPWRKQQAERPKTALDLLHRDQGGLIYQPLVGVHAHVGEIDFISMYPGIMVRCNISPEVPPPGPLSPADDRPGLIPQTLAPLLAKRVALKHELAQLPGWHPQRKALKARSSAHKWLLVTCFGYLGYKNARFGRIEAHEAVTSSGREALLRAKEAAEDLGFTVLHLYVDGMWVQRADARHPADFTPLLEEIASRCGLPIALEGVYRWVVFLPSRVDARLPVANRYFGVYQDGSLKVRGIEARRRDTAPFIAESQMELLQWLARAESLEQVADYLPGALALLRRRVRRLRRGEVPLEHLLAGLKLSRQLEAYKTPSAAARAARQLRQAGKEVRPGQRIRLLYLRGDPGVHAWDLPAPPDRRALDVDYYVRLLLRAAAAILAPFGIPEDELPARLMGEPRPQLLQPVRGEPDAAATLDLPSAMDLRVASA